jgi:hypothetical protein
MLNSTLEPDKLVRLQRSLPRSTALLVRVRAGLGNVGLQCFHVLLEQAQPVAHALQPRRGRLICSEGISQSVSMLYTEHFSH